MDSVLWRPAPGSETDGGSDIEGDSYSRLSPTDLMFLRLESDVWPCHFGGLAIVDAAALHDGTGEIPIERIRCRVGNRIGRVPELRRRLQPSGPFGGPPVWVDDLRFAIENHVKAAAVKTPGDESQLLELATSVYEKRLDRQRPLWELWLLTGALDGRAGVLLKLHHSMADGLAAVAIMGALFDLEAGAPEPAPVARTPRRMPTRRALRRENLSAKAGVALDAIGALAHPLRVAESIGRAAHMTGRYLAATGAAGGSLNQPVGRGRRVDFINVDLAEAREAAHALRGKVNDVILTVWAGGLRHLLQSRGEPVDGVELITGLAATLRPSMKAEGVDNQVGTLVVPLSISEAESVRRLDRIIRTTRRVKAEQRPAAIMGYLAGLAATPIGKYFVAHQRSTNVIVSNVIGPPVPVYFQAAEVLRILPIIELVGNIGITLCAFSYAGTISMVVTADATAFPDLDVLMRGMEQDWEALRPLNGNP